MKILETFFYFFQITYKVNKIGNISKNLTFLTSTVYIFGTIENNFT